MIIYFEGLSCSGKSSLIKLFSEQNKNSIIISELPHDFNDHEKITTNFCRLNDQRKCAQAKQSSTKDNFVLVDRSYVSTLAYEFIQWGSRTNSQYIKTLRWYYKGIATKGLNYPDLYVYIEIDKKTALKRSKISNRFTLKFAWYINPQLGIEFYGAFFKFFEPHIPVIIIDGSQDQNDQLETLQKGLQKFSNA